MSDSFSECYAVHSGKKVGIYYSWPEVQEQIDGVTNAVYRKCSKIEIADHVVEHGVLPWKEHLETTHIFIFEQATMYSIYFDCFGVKNIVEKVPKEWGREQMTRDLSSLLAVSKCLEICATHHKYLPKETPIIIHFQYHYAYNCLTRWITSWKKNCWYNTSKSIESYKILLQIIDQQTTQLPNVHFNYVHNKNIVSGITGFQKAKKQLLFFGKNQSSSQIS